MRWTLALILSITAGAVLASEVTLPLTLKFGNGELSLSEGTGGIAYSLVNEGGLKTTKSIVSVKGTTLQRNGGRYSVNDCSGDDESCIELVADDVTVTFKREINDRSLSIHTNIVSSSLENTTRVCVELGDGVHWFGGPEAKYQIWPVQDAVWNYTVYGPKEDDAVAIAEPYWFNSEGSYIYINPVTALFIDQNNYLDGHLCFFAENVSPYRERNYTSLEFWTDTLSNPREAHEAVVKKFFPKPTGIPDERMISQPIWSTWARYKVHVNDSIVREYANEILDYGFNHSQLEIDDFWETCYGSLTFDTSASKFPSIKNLTDYLHDLGFRVTLWIHPFINADCEPYHTVAKDNGYFVKDINGSIETTWWQGPNSSVIDFTNEAAVEWFSSRLTALKESAGIDSFKFDAGEASWAPEPAVLTGSIDLSPGIYTTKFARALAEFGSFIEIRTGWQTQDLPVFVRMLDKDTSWTLENGLPTLITTLLVMNMAGYGFVLPDMVGGNGYVWGVLDTTEYPSKELFVRWLQANTFMPSIQYSFVPWDFDNETVEICRTFTELHEEYAPTIIEAMNAAVANGTPVNPPVWWVDPTNSEAYNISDEYLVGEVILVAPVIVEGAVTRNIFLPKGTWRDATYSPHVAYEGPIWLHDYPAPLGVLPYFVEESYWQALGKSGAFLSSPSLTVICTSALFSLIIIMIN